jgi:N-acetyl-anhydromuramyl-L-alanine amidase AmpD
MNIQRQLISINYSKGVIINPRYIVVHDTDNRKRRANAKANRDYFANHPDAQASAHYTVDQDNIIQVLEDIWRGWHCGDVYNPKINNSNSIGIELCVNEDNDFAKTLLNGIELTKYLMNKYNIPVENVIRHHDVTGKICPKYMIQDHPELWGQFKEAVGGKTIGNIVVTTPVQDDPISKGKKFIGYKCKELQEKLIALGYDLGTYGADGDFGKVTYNALLKFQKDNGLVVDGLAGTNTFNKLDELLSNKTETNEYDFRSLQGFIGVSQDNLPGPITLSKCPLVKKGSSGNVVKWLQDRLNYLGFNCGAVDGLFGEKTRAAIVAFQASIGLSADGVVGQNTWGKLLGI